jgi:chitin disaccharide deacetylase
MVPCPWAREAASRYRGEDIGVALTLNAEHPLYRWGPITHAPSLLDGNGGFPQTVTDTWDHADLDEVRRECRSQIERAVFWGFDVSHLDSHIGVLELRPEFFDLYVDLALEFQLPMRLPGPGVEKIAGFPFRALAADEGVVFPDHAIDIGPNSSRELERALDNLAPGVTEIRFWPAIDTDELRALDRSWSENVEHHDLLTHNDDMRALLRRTGAVLTDYRALRAVQRKS